MAVELAIVIRRTTDRVEELNSGPLILEHGQWGYAALDKRIVIRDLAGNFSYVETSDSIGAQLYIKEPVQSTSQLLPSDQDGTLRMVLDENSYWFKAASGWARIPDTGYYDSAIAAKQDILEAGENIQIDGNVISATDTVYDDSALRTQIEALHGAIIYLGNINLSTAQIAANTALLTQWAQDNNSYPLKPGYVIIDSQANDWWWNGSAWVNIGYYEVATATSASKGVVKGSSADMKVGVDESGEMSVNGLQAKLDSKQGTLNRTVGGNDNAIGTVPDTGGNLSVPIPVATTAGASDSSQLPAGTNSLRVVIQKVLNNLANLFSRMGTAETNISGKVSKSGDTMSGPLTVPTIQSDSDTLNIGTDNSNGNLKTYGNIYVNTGSDDVMVIENDDYSWRGRLNPGTAGLVYTDSSGNVAKILPADLQIYSGDTSIDESDVHQYGYRTISDWILALRQEVLWQKRRWVSRSMFLTTFFNLQAVESSIQNNITDDGMSYYNGFMCVVNFDFNSGQVNPDTLILRAPTNNNCPMIQQKMYVVVVNIAGGANSGATRALYLSHPANRAFGVYSVTGLPAGRWVGSLCYFKDV